MGTKGCTWLLLPNAAWQVVSNRLEREDLLAARLVCRAWRKDLGTFVSVATAIPSQLVLITNPYSAGDVFIDSSARASGSALQAAVADCHATAAQGVAASAEAAAAAALAAAEDALSKDLQDTEYAAMQSGVEPGGVQALMEAFPHCDVIHVDISSQAEQQLAAIVINTLARGSTGNSSGRASSDIAPTACISAAQRLSTNSSSSSTASEPGPCRAGVEEQPEGTRCNQRQHTGGSRSRVQSVLRSPSKSSPLLTLGARAPRPRLCLNALQRSYHCHAKQEFPSGPGCGRDVFHLLAQLPSQLTAAGLSCLVSVQLDMFPDAPGQWAVLQRLPCLRELVLPSFRPSVPHEHLPTLAQLTQLEALTLSVQGSITAWRANCAAYTSLSQLSRLVRLSLHAFHCPGAQLAAALLHLTALAELRLSGRIVLEPLEGLSSLTQLTVLELTQDLQYSALCDLVRSLPQLAQLAVGRVTLPPPPPPPPAANVAAGAAGQPINAAAAAHGPGLGAAAGAAFPGVWQQGPQAAWPPPHPAAAGPQAAAAAAADVGDGAAADAPPAAAEAAAVVVAADGGGAAVAAAAVAADGGGGEVMLEDVGAIVDGLIGNLQDGAVPVHLQRIIERFESIIQLDLTRRAATSPWGWPIAGLPLLAELGVTQQGQQQHRPHGRTAATNCSRSSVAATQSCSRGSAGFSSFELALLRPADVLRLQELPSQLRSCSHLGLRLRDQLLAFASVCPVRLLPGQLSSLGAAFTSLASLSLCGKVAMDGDVLLELAQGLAALPEAADEAGQGCSAGTATPRLHAAAGSTCSSGQPFQQASGPAGWPSNSASSSGLVCLSLDCHFVAVSPEQMAAALQQLQGLKVLSVRHRGGGKLPIPLSALPRSITSLAAKKVLLYHERPCTNRTLRASRGQQQQQLVLPLETPLVDCHALTSPGFGKVVSAGIISAAPSAVDLAQLAATADSTMQGVYQRSSNSSIAGQATEDGTASEAAGSISGQGYGAVLPHLDSLFIKNCLVSSHTLQQLLLGVRVAAGLQAAAGGSSAPAGATGDVCSGSCQLVRLAVTGDNAAHGEASEGWPNWPWLAVVQQLTNLQVLDLTVPDSLGSPAPPSLLDTLAGLPRLAHLHLSISQAPQQLLLCLTRLKGLRTLSLNYTGPPTLPSHLLGQLQAGLGPHCKVQLWEMVVMQHTNSFGGSGSGDVEGAELPGRRANRLRQLAGAAGRCAALMGAWFCGWTLANVVVAKLERRRTLRRRLSL